MKMRVPLAALFAVTLSGTVAAQPVGRCTRETLPVRGQPVTATLCVVAMGPRFAHELPVTVNETFTSPNGSFNQENSFRFIAGEPASRVLEDVDLSRLGMEGTLHLSLMLMPRRGEIRIDSAMLSPGAITVK